MRSFLRWVGGKSKLSGEIVKRIPAHDCYCEVFAGAAWAFFEKDPKISTVEVINDINSELMTLYRVLQNHHDIFIEYTSRTLCSREEFERLRALPPHLLTDIQRATRFFYLVKTCFGGRIKSPTFGVTTTRSLGWSPDAMKVTLEAVHERLSRVMIENQPYQKILSLYDRDNTFFYIDPPYYNSENVYGPDIFSKEDFQILSNLLGDIKGKFLLSINDTPETREIFGGFLVEEIQTRYTVSANNNNQVVTELLISNYQKE